MLVVMLVRTRLVVNGRSGRGARRFGQVVDWMRTYSSLLMFFFPLGLPSASIFQARPCFDVGFCDATTTTTINDKYTTFSKRVGPLRLYDKIRVLQCSIGASQNLHYYSLTPLSQSAKQAKQMLTSQQERVKAQQAAAVHVISNGDVRLGGEETVLIPAPGAYPTALTNESQECLHQGLRVVYVLAQHMPNFLEVCRLLFGCHACSAWGVGEEKREEGGDDS